MPGFAPTLRFGVTATQYPWQLDATLHVLHPLEPEDIGPNVWGFTVVQAQVNLSPHSWGKGVFQ